MAWRINIALFCRARYQLLNLSIASEVAQWSTSSCSQPQPATDNGHRDEKFN